MCSWESLSIPFDHVLMLAVERSVLRGEEGRVESHVHRGNCWSSSSSRRDWVSSTRSVSSWIESGRAAFGRVVENARTGFALKGETRRKRASIGVGVAEREQYGSKQVRAVTSSDFIPGFIRILLVVGDGVADVEAPQRRGNKGKSKEIGNARRYLNQPSSRVVTVLAPTRSFFLPVMSILRMLRL